VARVTAIPAITHDYRAAVFGQFIHVYMVEKTCFIALKEMERNSSLYWFMTADLQESPEIIKRC